MFSFLKRKPPARSVIDGATVKALLDVALRSSKTANYRHFAQKDAMAVVTMDDIEKASRKSYAPWRKDVWECEDIARSLIDGAQRMAANEGKSWAVGILRADGPTADSLHVYVWAVVHREGRFGSRDVVFFDPTARLWTSAGQINNVDYTLT